MLADRHALRRKLRDVADLQQLADENSKLKAQRLLGEIAQKVHQSQQKYAARLASLPKPEYPLELPVSSRRDEIAQAIQQHQVVIVCGETGSGKTTQLPKICLGLGRGVSGLIGHTQPRRIAARAVATRIAQELNSPLGQVVAPPIWKTCGVFRSDAVPMISGTSFGVVTQTLGTPATSAGMTVINTVDGSG